MTATPVRTKTVNLSPLTLSVLNNFSLINSSIVFKTGSVIKTCSVADNIIGEYKCEEYFPRDFAIYDLSQFLAGIRILDNPSLVFDNDEYVVLRGTNMSMRYYFSDPAITLKNANYGKDFPFPDSCMNLPVSEDVLGKIQNVSSQFRLPDLIFTSSSDKVSIVLKDSENDTGNVCTLDFPQATTTEDNELSLKIENLRVHNKFSYDVSVSDALVTKWSATSLGTEDISLTYFIAMEPK